MKFTKTTLFTIPLFVVLAFSLSFTGTTTTAQSPGPYADTQTGDWFKFGLDGSSSFSSGREFNLWNQTDVLDVHREENNARWDNTTYNGWMEVNFARDANVSGDTWVQVTRETTNVAPSQRGGYEFVSQKGDPSQDRNDTFPVEDTVGENRYYEDSSPVRSNATYSVIFDEVEDGQVRTEIRTDFIGPNLPMAPEYAQMDSLWVSTNTMNLNINGQAMTMSVTVVTATFSLDWIEPFSTTSFPLGDTDPVTYSVNQTLSYQAIMEYFYDSSNGKFLGSNSSTSGSYEAFMWADSFQITRAGVADPSNFASNQTIYFDFSSEESFLMTDASSGYGNIRPVSSGINRLMEGDTLVYAVESSGRYASSFEVTSSDPANTQNWNRKDTANFEATGDGTMDLRVFRHAPGYIEALVVFRQENSISESRQVTEMLNGVNQPVRPEENYQRTRIEQMFSIDIFDSSSNATNEIGAQLDQQMFFNINDDNQDCRDCGDDQLHFPVNNVMNMENSDNLEFIPTPEVAGEPIIVINGNSFYVLTVESLNATYSNSTSGILQLRLGDRPDSPWINATFTMTSKGEQGYFWDVNTGVLLRIQESWQVEITITFNGQVPSEMDPTVLNDMALTGTISIENKFNMMLKSHPKEYSIGQEPPVTSTSTPTSSSTSTTDTTTATGTTTSSDTSNGAALPLPVPPVSIFVGLAVVAVIAKKRKF